MLAVSPSALFSYIALWVGPGRVDSLRRDLKEKTTLFLNEGKFSLGRSQGRKPRGSLP